MGNVFALDSSTDEIKAAAGNSGSYIVSFSGTLNNAINIDGESDGHIRINLKIDGELVGSFYANAEGHNIVGTVVIDIPNTASVITLVVDPTNNVTFADGLVPSLVIFEPGVSEHAYKDLTTAAMLPMKEQAGVLVKNQNFINFGFDAANNPGNTTNSKVISFSQEANLDLDSTAYDYTLIHVAEEGYYNLDWWFSINGADAPDYLELSLLDIPMIVKPYANVDIEDEDDINLYNKITSIEGINYVVLNPAFVPVAPSVDSKATPGLQLSIQSTYPVSTTGQIVGHAIIDTGVIASQTYEAPKLTTMIIDGIERQVASIDDAPIEVDSIEVVYFGLALQNNSGSATSRVMITSKSGGNSTMQGSMKVFGSHKLTI